MNLFPARWSAVVNYEEPGDMFDHPQSLSQTLEFDEFDELADFIESGPDWNLITSIRIILNGSAHNDPYGPLFAYRNSGAI